MVQNRYIEGLLGLLHEYHQILRIFFQIIKKPTHSISKRSGLGLESRITKGKKEVSNRRADIFFRFRPGELVAFANGKDRSCGLLCNI